MKIKYLIRKRAMGDVLWIEPIIRELATKNKKVIVFTKFNELYYNYPYNNVVFKDKLNFFEKFFSRLEGLLNTNILFINLDNSYERNKKTHILHAYQQKAGLAAKDEYPRLYLSEQEKQIPFFKGPRYVVLHIESFSPWNYRRIYGVNFKNIVTYIKEKGYEVVMLGKNAGEIDGIVSLKTSIREMINVIYHSSFFIGLDSGPSHIAASLEKPALIFFGGAIKPEYRHFPGLFKGFFLQGYCEFAGCYHEGKGIKESYCKLVGNAGTPKCCLFNDEHVENKINLLSKEYLYRDDKKN